MSADGYDANTTDAGLIAHRHATGRIVHLQNNVRSGGHQLRRRLRPFIRHAAGSINKQLVSAIIRAGKLAVGLSGVDGLLTRAMPRDPELGSVGNPNTTDAWLIDSLVNLGYVPVIACVAADEHGNMYNVNADQMAVSCALGWRSDTLMLLTDVDGVKGKHGNILGELSLEDIQELIASGVANRGMRAKLTSAAEAMRAGLQELIIASGHEHRICHRLLSGEAIGTRLSSEHVFAKGLVP